MIEINNETLDRMSGIDLHNFVVLEHRKQLNGEDNYPDYIFDVNGDEIKIYVRIIGVGPKHGYEYLRKVYINGNSEHNDD